MLRILAENTHFLRLKVPKLYFGPRSFLSALLQSFTTDRHMLSPRTLHPYCPMAVALVEIIFTKHLSKVFHSECSAADWFVKPAFAVRLMLQAPSLLIPPLYYPCLLGSFTGDNQLRSYAIITLQNYFHCLYYPGRFYPALFKLAQTQIQDYTVFYLYTLQLFAAV